jgi:hypothetical protein
MSTQSLVSLRRIEKYLNSAEVSPVPPLAGQEQLMAFQSATVTWPQDRTQSSASASATPSASSTPRHKFILMDLSLTFPPSKLSLICGKLGSGKTLLLLGVFPCVDHLCLLIPSSDSPTALLGEVDLLTGQVICPRSPPDSLASFAGVRVPKEKWIVQGICAYVPQVKDLLLGSQPRSYCFIVSMASQRFDQR